MDSYGRLLDHENDKVFISPKDRKRGVAFKLLHLVLGGRTRAPPDPPLMSASGLPIYWLFNKDLIKKLINREAGGRH